jgi:3-methyladenine DNA glycosylase/8-oxoguanine DNA glycosylase
VIKRKLILQVPDDFNFWRTVFSHGWCRLAPFSVDRERRVLKRIVKTRRQPVSLEVEASSPDRLEVRLLAHQPLLGSDVEEVRSQVVTMLRLDESMRDFYEALRATGDGAALDWIARARAGRLLRGPSLFEDIVKMICTTNCAWSATERMVHNLVTKLGMPFDEEQSCFPSPEELAAASEDFLIREVRAGYRSGYLIELANAVASGRLDLASYLDPTRDDLYPRLLEIKGIGPYAAGNLLKLLGRYDFLALDSWCRQRFSQLYRSERKVSDRTIARRYKRYGPWQGLVMWLELTREWFDEE